MKKRIIALLLCLVLLLPLCSCGKKQDTLTMYIGLGLTNTGYYAALHELILQETGIEVQFVYTSTVDTTNELLDMLRHGEVPADIVATASPSDAELQAASFLDLAASTNIPDRFSVLTLQGANVDSAIYQLPFASRLIGIEYNKTLFEEQGWSVPQTMEDMAALKVLADEAGYKFAVSGGVATGHGMNYLLNVMGSEFLATPDGSEWLSDFQSGDTDAEQFARRSAYFEAYVQAGLMGHMHTADWSAKLEFSRERALFYYNTINDIASYDGYRYLPDGSLYGAEYGEDGLPAAVESETGEAVFVNGEYVLYNESNAAHQGLTRYTIPGAQVLHDSYGNMPWVSSTGTSNCYVLYNCMYLALNKALGEKSSEAKLEKAVKVLEFMSTAPATDLYSSILSDGYVGVKDYDMGSDRMYSAFADRVSAGYLMHWFYGSFDTESIVHVGGKVNEYIQGGETTFSDVIATLTEYNDRNLSNTVELAGTAEKTLDYQDNATLQAIVNGQSLQKTLDAAGESVEITASLLPYMEKLGDINAEKSTAVVQTKLYAGEVRQTTLSMYVNGRSQKPVAIRMTGAELKALLKSGYSALADLELNHVFPYKLVLKGGGKLSDSQEYYVAVPASSLEKAVYERFCDEGRVLLDSAGKAYTGNTVNGLNDYFARYHTVSPASLLWE